MCIVAEIQTVNHREGKLNAIVLITTQDNSRFTVNEALRLIRADRSNQSSEELLTHALKRCVSLWST